jgi:uncharacterized membrane protein YhaH (DUF805 family)
MAAMTGNRAIILVSVWVILVVFVGVLLAVFVRRRHGADLPNPNNCRSRWLG